ncbi:MAG TPA: type II toxin-antitoxin system VapC family toxin [Xanthobacteraceae bacterium]|nr:type II toxin-antitoxin system VapC family toxin [Xanthobacteraceae bacterium]
MIVVDTHVAVWMTTGTAFGKRSMAIVKRAFIEQNLAISAISFWEIAMLMAKRRLRTLKSASDQRAKILDAGVLELPLQGEICVLAGELENLHADPADRLIAATAIAHGATLVTADERLLRWRHALPRQNAEH